MKNWEETYHQLLEGDQLSGAETEFLIEALKDSQNSHDAKEWIAFDLLLSGLFASRVNVQESVDRLFAKTVLKEKHAELIKQELIDDSDSSRVEPLKKDSILNPRRSRRSEKLWERANELWIPAAIVLIGLGITFFAFWQDKPATTYTNAVAFGEYRILGESDYESPGAIRRGDRIVSGGSGTQLKIGDYCDLYLESHTDVTLRGLPFQEEVELHQGVLKAQIKPDIGAFRVWTPLGSVVVKGTEFETIVEYPNGMPGDLSMNNAKKVIVTVAVITGSVLCEFGNSPTLLTAGERHKFEDNVKVEKTTGVVASKNGSSVTIKLDSGKTETFQIGSNKLTVHEAEQLLVGDKITIVWNSESDKRWIRDIQGEGKVEGRITNLGDAWIELEVDKQQKIRLRAPWRGGNPGDGGGPDKEVVKKIGSLKNGDVVSVTWAMPEGKRVTDIRIKKRKPDDLTKAPKELFGLSGRVIGRLVSKDVEKGELTLKIVKVDKVWKNNKASQPKSAEGRTLKIDGVFGKFLDVLLTLKKGDGVQIEVKHVRGDGLTFLGEELKRVELEESAEDREEKPSERIKADDKESPPGLRGFRGILIGELVSKDIEKGTLVFKMEKVQRVWKANKAPAPEKSKGKLIAVEGISGKFLDALLVLKVGDRIEVEAFQVSGPTLKFPGEWLKKAK